jgi:hypothetical protein
MSLLEFWCARVEVNKGIVDMGDSGLAEQYRIRVQGGVLPASGTTVGVLPHLV